MIISSHALSNSSLHQTRQRRKNVNWRVDTSLVHVSVNVYLPFSNVSSQIWNRMCDIVIRHCQNRDLGDGATLALHSTSSLVDGGQICVHVTRVTSSSGDLFSGSRDFSQGVCVGSHIGQDGEHMHFFGVRQMLGSGQSKTRSDDTLDGWVVGVVHEQDNSVHGAIHFEVSFEESGSFQVDTHCCENNTKVFFGVIEDIFVSFFSQLFDQRGLSANLGTNFVVRKTSSREEWNLLPSSNGCHCVDGRDTCLDHFLWIDSLKWINWLTLKTHKNN